VPANANLHQLHLTVAVGYTMKLAVAYARRLASANPAAL
jgi:hypothetical protein